MGLLQAKPAVPDNTIKVSVPMPVAPPAQTIIKSTGGWYKVFFWLFVLTCVGLGVAFIYGKVTGTSGTSGLPGLDKNSPLGTPTTPTSGKSVTTISNLPVITNSDFTIQFWLNVNDWEYNYNTKKTLLVFESNNPKISLHPTENKLMVSVNMTGGTATAPIVFEFEVEDIPIQTWTSISITFFQRNVDTYIGGKLVKSVVLPGIMALNNKTTATNTIVVGSATAGFSGSVCDVTMKPASIGPIDAESFQGTGCSCVAKKPASPTNNRKSWHMSIFGLDFSFTDHFENENKVKRNQW
jgi:hypothetical protein